LSGLHRRAIGRNGGLRHRNLRVRGIEILSRYITPGSQRRGPRQLLHCVREARLITEACGAGLLQLGREQVIVESRQDLPGPYRCSRGEIERSNLSVDTRLDGDVLVRFEGPNPRQFDGNVPVLDGRDNDRCRALEGRG